MASSTHAKAHHHTPLQSPARGHEPRTTPDQGPRSNQHRIAQLHDRAPQDPTTDTFAGLGWGAGLQSVVGVAHTGSPSAPDLRRTADQAKARAQAVLADKLSGYTFTDVHLEWLAACTRPNFEKWVVQAYLARNGGGSLPMHRQLDYARTLGAWFVATAQPAVAAWKATNDAWEAQPAAGAHRRQAPPTRRRVRRRAPSRPVRAPRTAPPKAPASGTAGRAPAKPPMSAQEKARKVAECQQKMKALAKLEKQLRSDQKALASVRHYMKPTRKSLGRKLILDIFRQMAKEPHGSAGPVADAQEEDLKEHHQRQRIAREKMLVARIAKVRPQIARLKREIAQLQRIIPPPFGFVTSGT